MVGIVVEAVADGQVLAGLLTRGDHRLALRDRRGHGLLTDDVLTSAEGIDDVLGVDAGRRHHVDDVDVLVRGDFVPLVVAVDVFDRETMRLRQLLALGARAGDGADQTNVRRLEQSRGQFAIGITTQAAEGQAEFAALRLVSRKQARCKSESGGRGGEGAEELTT